MTLTKWDRSNRPNGYSQSAAYPQNLPAINSDLGSLMPRLLNNFTRPLFSGSFIQDFFDDAINLGTGNIGTTLPAVNITETDADLFIEVAAPGMNKKDFKVEIIDDQLHIGYSKQSKEENTQYNHWRKEFSFESFERTFSLPTIVESDKIKATYTDGILKISVPKKEEARRKPAKTIVIQ